MVVPWTPGLELVCSSCAARHAPGSLWFGCPARGEPLETYYPPACQHALPIPPERTTDLGQTPTPQLWLDSERTLLKLEQRNPTNSHKDRFHEITSAIARELGAAGVVTTSTGNHGVSCAAHAARDGLPAVVLSTGDLPRALHAQIAAHGALVAVLPPDERRAALLALVDENWVPATSTDPKLSGAGNPYGADGYRLIVDEIVAHLGTLPTALAVPAASGDTIVGITRAVLAHAAARGQAPPLLLACQPEGAATIEASLTRECQVALHQPRSIARSTADPMTGRLAIKAVADYGSPISVSEEAIAATTRELARLGLYVEASSALALAGLRVARRAGRVTPEDICAAIITSGGRGWNESEPTLAGPLRVIRSAKTLLAECGARASLGLRAESVQGRSLLATERGSPST
jgi:threonine synthase